VPSHKQLKEVSW